MDTHEELHYYMAPRYLADTLEQRRVRAYNVYSMDDDDEISFAYKPVQERLGERIKNLKLPNQGATSASKLLQWLDARFAPTPAHVPQIFVRSLAESADDNGLWAEYTTGKAGVCLSFSRVKLGEIAQLSDMTLLPVIYEPKEQDQVIRQLYGTFMTLAMRTPNLGNSTERHFELFDTQIDEALRALASLKYNGWSGQREWRLVSKMLPTNSPRIKQGEKFRKPTTYIDVDLGGAPACSRVITGPLIPRDDFDQVEKIAMNHGVSIEKSNIKLKAPPTP